MTSWKITGIIATLCIVLSIPLYLLKTANKSIPPQDVQADQAGTFVGSLKCMECHRKEYNQRQNSHHDLAMDLANEKTVLGNFSNVRFNMHGVESRFYRKDDKFFVHTQGPDGLMGDFEITHTFGWFPLQQYLVPFAGGRLQCLPIAWDCKDKRWFHLQPEGAMDPKDWLYWTNAGQNWNGMCAECHSTNLKKNYDIQTDTYQTVWSDIDVGCEACHGPGSRHVKWAEMPDMARPEVKNYQLMVKTGNIGSREQVEICAPCHSRRAILGDYTHAEPDLLDSLLPSLLTEDLYFPDGQILDEVYVYGSFTQSKMYHRNVRCSDCHNVHSLKTVKTGNDLCLQCHRADEYDTKAHHFHKKPGEAGEPIQAANGKILFDVGSGSQCVQCHMPGRNYMVIDYRPDHGFRVPRPDLSMTIDTPNACNRCHADQTAKWSDEYMTKWYGPGRSRHYGEIIKAGRDRAPEAYRELLRLAADPLYPVIVRATTLSLLNAYPGKETNRIYELSLMDDEALIRRTATEFLKTADGDQQAMMMAPLLYDPVKAVRTQAASRLTGEPSKRLDANQKKVFERVLNEFVASMEYSGDFAFGRYNLANLYATLNRTEDAVQNYRAALKIDDLFYPAKVNLAMLYNQLGNKRDAERLLSDVIKANPELHEVQYSLGLLLAEEKRYKEAVIHLDAAAKGMPEYARAHYNLGQLLDYLNINGKAQAALEHAYSLEPQNPDYIKNLVLYYFKRKMFAKAQQITEDILTSDPHSGLGRQLQTYIDQAIKKSK